MKHGAWLRAALYGLAIPFTLASDPVVTIEKSQVTYRGQLKGAVEDFQNIKFAHDTSGARRFAPPEPYTPPSGSEVDATSPGPACPQLKAGIPPFFSETPNQSEDCLNLRITRPTGIASASSAKLPVVVHLACGGVIKGSTYDELVDPANLVAHSVTLDQPVIHVVINHRLTIFGFARLPILKDQKSLNVGMRDQRAAFQWIKDNIAAFGGDPDRVTVFGLSAGGTFASLHLMAYGGEHGVPFTQAWVMSGPPGTALNMTSDATEIHTHAVASELGCESNSDDAAILECLRGIPMDKLTETAMDYSIRNHPPAGLFTFIPSVDGDFMPERQSVLYKEGKFVKEVPIVFGYTEDDGATNAGLAPSFETEESMKGPIKNFAHALTDDDYEQLFYRYPAESFEEEVHNYEARKTDADPVAPVHYFRIARIMRDLLFTCSSIDFGFEMARQSKSKGSDFPGVYHYVLNQSMVTPLFHKMGMPYLGAIHGSDLDYIYNNMFPRDQLSEQDKALSDAMTESFLNFAYTGRPGSDKGGLSWPESFSGFEDVSDQAGPEGFELQVFGGPLGTGSARVTRRPSLSEGEESMQSPLMGEQDVEYGEMKTPITQERQRLVEREELLERCAFINSLAEKLGH